MSSNLILNHTIFQEKVAKKISIKFKRKHIRIMKSKKKEEEMISNKLNNN